MNDDIQVPTNAFPGYKYHPHNHPDGTANGGVGIFFKETLPLRIREDLSLSEILVSEIILGKKKIFFTVLYRNPKDSANSDEFETFLANFEALHQNIKAENPYAMFFTGDFNAQSQSWYTQGETNNEGHKLENLFSDIGLDQLIKEPTHFMRDDCNPTCIDLILTDQANLVLDSGVRTSLDRTVKHQITYTKINYKIPPLPSYKRKIWYYDRADQDLINRTLLEKKLSENIKKKRLPKRGQNYP